MNDQDDRSREQLLQEVAALRARVAELETSAEKLKQSDSPVEIAGEPYHWQGRGGMAGLFHDITEATLRDSEERLALTIAGAELGTWDWHVPSGRVVYNERWAEMLGYTLAEIKPHVSSWEKLVHPDDVTAVTASVNAHLAGQTPFYQSEHRLRSKSGEWKWVLDTGKVFERNDQGQPVRMVGIHQNITERKRMEEALRENEVNFQAFFNTLDYLLFVLDNQGRIIWTNDTVKRRLGYTDAELNGQSVLVVHPPQWRDEAARTVQAMLTGQADYCPIPVQTKDGRLIPVETRVSKGQWSGQEVILGVTKDISALKASEEKFVKAFQASPLLMAISEPDTGRYLDANDTFLDTLGYTRDEIIGRTTGELDLFVRPDQRAAALQRLRAQGRLRDFEAAVYTKSGQIREGLFAVEYIQLQDRPVLLTAMHDITERKQMERIEAAQLAVSQILAGSPEPAAGLRQVLVSMAGRLDGQIAELWQCGHDGHLTWCDGWRAPELAEFERASQGYTFRPGQGLPGAVWQAGQAMWDKEMLLAPEHPRAPLVAAAGFLSATGVPITVDGDPVAVMIFFSRSDWPLDERLLAALTDLGRQIGQFLARKQAEADRECLIAELQAALTKVKQLEGILPICSFCKKIRDQDDQWHQLEDYISHHSGAEFSHTFCPSCGRKYYPDFFTDLRE